MLVELRVVLTRSSYMASCRAWTIGRKRRSPVSCAGVSPCKAAISAMISRALSLFLGTIANGAGARYRAGIAHVFHSGLDTLGHTWLSRDVSGAICSNGVGPPLALRRRQEFSAPAARLTILPRFRPFRQWPSFSRSQTTLGDSASVPSPPPHEPRSKDRTQLSGVRRIRSSDRESHQLASDTR